MIFKQKYKPIIKLDIESNTLITSMTTYLGNIIDDGFNLEWEHKEN